VARAGDGVPRAGDGADRGRRPRLPGRLGTARLPVVRRGLRHHVAAGPGRRRPAARADLHAGDEGGARRARLRELTLGIYTFAAELAAGRGIILADTKFEFGRDSAGQLVLGDEVLTPDSSRFWPADGWQPGSAQPSFDKQYVRNWLLSEDAGWDRSAGAAPPALPDAVVAATRDRYIEAYERLTGLSFADWPGG
jgi:phosphoribosylaminoimidazole-succinocarboxamide synthase